MLDKLGGLLGGNKVVAIDIGTSSVKLAELDSSRSGYQLKKFGVISLNPGWIRDGEIVEPANVAQVIQSLVESVKCKRKTASTGIFGNGVIIKRIQMQPIEENLMAEAIKWEAEQYIPFDINEAAIDYHVLNKGSVTAAGTTDVLLIGAKQEFIFRILEAVETAGLRCSIMDVSAFALANCFEANYGARPGATALLNIGAGVTNVVILEEGNVVFARDVIIGGQNYTMEIHKALGVSIPEAESLKISASLGQEVPNEVISIITNTTEQVVEEIRNAFEFYTATGGGNKPDLMFVSGGCIFIPNLVEELSKVLGVGFEVFNPFQSITYDSKVLSAEYIQQIQSIAPVVLGLGMRGSKEK